MEIGVFFAFILAPGKKLAAGMAVSGLLAVLLAAQASAPPHRRAQSPRVEAAEPDKAHGKQVFQQNCAICHFSTSTAKKIGPGLKGLAARGHYSNGNKVDEASLRHWIEHGDTDMQGFGARLKPDDVRDLIAYLKTL